MRARLRCSAAAFVLLTSACVGCGAKAPTPAEYLNVKRGINTPHGAVVPGSADDLENGKVRYQVQGGGVFEATATSDDEGGYTFSDTRRLETSPTASP